MLGASLRCTDDKVLGFDEGIKLEIFDSKVFVTIIGDVDGNTLVIGVGHFRSEELK